MLTNNLPLSLDHYRQQKAAEQQLRSRLTLCVAFFDLSLFVLTLFRIF